MKATVTKAQARITSIAARETTRYAIHGIAAERGLLVATDGRRLVALRAAVETDEPSIVSTEAIERAGKSATKRQGAQIDNGDGFHRVAGESFPVVDETFPNWRDVIPATDDGYTKVTLNGRYLAELADLLQRVALDADPRCDTASVSLWVKPAKRNYCGLGDIGYPVLMAAETTTKDKRSGGIVNKVHGIAALMPIAANPAPWETVRKAVCGE